MTGSFVVKPGTVGAAAVPPKSPASCTMPALPGVAASMSKSPLDRIFNVPSALCSTLKKSFKIDPHAPASWPGFGNLAIFYSHYVFAKKLWDKSNSKSSSLKEQYGYAYFLSKLKARRGAALQIESARGSPTGVYTSLVPSLFQRLPAPTSSGISSSSSSWLPTCWVCSQAVWRVRWRLIAMIAAIPNITW